MKLNGNCLKENMKTPGFVYVLINPSIPNYVKIGKTTKDPSARAAELSSATGVPTPFHVAYEAYFDDCDSAEVFVHTLLESKGRRLSQNREFFAVQPTIAINAILEAKRKEEMEKKLYGGTPDNSSEIYSDKLDDHEKLWKVILEEATRYHYGMDDVLEDHERAMQLYKEAIKLGAGEVAYIQLAKLCRETLNDLDQGFQWLRLGAEKGFPACWLALTEIGGATSSVYFGRDIDRVAREFGMDARRAAIKKEEENLIKCYRKFFTLFDFHIEDRINYDIEIIWSKFNDYIRLINSNSEQRDSEILKGFIKKFRNEIFKPIYENQQGHNEKLRQIDIFVSKIKFI